MISVLEDNDTHALTFRTSACMHGAHTRTLIYQTRISVGMAVFVFLCHLIRNLLAASTKTSRAGKCLGSEEAVGKSARTQVSSVASVSDFLGYPPPQSPCRSHGAHPAPEQTTGHRGRATGSAAGGQSSRGWKLSGRRLAPGLFAAQSLHFGGQTRPT